MHQSFSQSTATVVDSARAEYADDQTLSVRYRTHQRYTVDPVDFGQWTLARLEWCGDERVLDVGCGPGDLLRALARREKGWGRLAGCDFSPGMARRATELSPGLPIQWLAADAQALPFPEGTFDVVMARHILYYVPDIDRAVAEATRVLRPGGRFLTTTNSAATMPEYEAYRQRAMAQFPWLWVETTPSVRFCLENAPGFLAPHLAHVETHVLRGTLRFLKAAPFVDYVASGRQAVARPGHSDAEWQAVLDWLTADVAAHIARDGHFDVTKIAGAVIGTKE